MKKLNKKLLAVGLIVLVFSAVLVYLVKAQVPEFGVDFFRVDSATTTPEGAKKAAPQGQTGPAITVINRSGKSYFVPNKTPGEFDSFRNNAPKYVFVDECGDAVCGEYENKDNCPEDCAAPAKLPYCGDNVCNSKITCTTRLVQVDIPLPPFCNFTTPQEITRGGVRWVRNAETEELIPLQNNLLTSVCDVNRPTRGFTVEYICDLKVPETYENCPDDCSPTSASNCGVCGYNGAGELCPNWCLGGAYTEEGCTFYYGTTAVNPLPYLVYNHTSPSRKSFLDAAQALAKLAPVKTTSVPQYRTIDGWGCSNIINRCSAGTLCEPNGLTTSTTIRPCAAGYFCPAGSWYERICPPGTYSTGGAGRCTACPAGTYSMPGAIASSSDGVIAGDKRFCYPVLVANDSSCQEAENAVNSNDCPDQFSKNPSHGVTNPNYNATNIIHSRQNTFYGDGRCSGVENSNPSSPFYSSDCFCGNGTCDPDESDASCYIDCAKGNGFCDSIYNPERPLAAQGLDETYENSNGDCYHGDGICDSAETIAKSPADCDNCGDGYCDSAGRFPEDIDNCYADCKCGNNYCDASAPWRETIYNCPSDCFCGNNKCELDKGEYSTGSGSCSDCRCGDGIKDISENTSNCFIDTHCGNGVCNASSPYNETYNNCYRDCPRSDPNTKLPYKPNYAL